MDEIITEKGPNSVIICEKLLGKLNFQGDREPEKIKHGRFFEINAYGNRSIIARYNNNKLVENVVIYEDGRLCDNGTWYGIGQWNKK